MKKIASSMFTISIIAALCISFLLYPGRLPTTKAAATVVDLKTTTQLKTEAGLYDTAIREISRIATVSLSTPEELKAAIAIVHKHRGNLKYSRSKATVIGLNDSIFTTSVKTLIKDQTAAEAFLRELNDDPNAILKARGAQSLRDRIKLGVDSDIAALRKAGNRLKQAAEDLKAKVKAHHPPFRKSVEESSLFETEPATGQKQAFETLGSYASFYAPVAVVALLAGPYVTGFAVGITLLERLIAFIGSEETRDNFTTCMQEVESRLQECHTQAAAQPFPLDIPAHAACDALYLLEAADCFLYS